MFNRQTQFNKITIDLNKIQDKSVVEALRVILESLNQDKEKLNTEFQNIERFAYTISSGGYSYNQTNLERALNNVKASFAKSLAQIRSGIVEYHNDLMGRDSPNVHPIESITNLRDELNDILRLINEIFSILQYSGFRAGIENVSTSGIYNITFNNLMSNNYVVICYTINNDDEISFPEILYNTAKINQISVNTNAGKLYWLVFPYQTSVYQDYYAGARNVNNGIVEVSFKRLQGVEYNVFAYTVTEENEIYFPEIIEQTEDNFKAVTVDGRMYWVLLYHNTEVGNKYRAGIANITEDGEYEIEFSALSTTNYICFAYTINNGIINFPKVLYETATNETIKVQTNAGTLHWNIIVYS